jgi:hypothetical protein
MLCLLARAQFLRQRGAHLLRTLGLRPSAGGGSPRRFHRQGDPDHWNTFTKEVPNGY